MEQLTNSLEKETEKLKEMEPEKNPEDNATGGSNSIILLGFVFCLLYCY